MFSYLSFGTWSQCLGLLRDGFQVGTLDFFATPVADHQRLGNRTQKGPRALS